VLFPFAIDDVVAEAAGGDERGVLRHLAGALQEVALGQVAHKERRSNDVEIALGERRARFEVLTQHAERAVWQPRDFRRHRSGLHHDSTGGLK
jgi:hypothetical protein